MKNLLIDDYVLCTKCETNPCECYEDLRQEWYEWRKKCKKEVEDIGISDWWIKALKTQEEEFKKVAEECVSEMKNTDAISLKCDWQQMKKNQGWNLKNSEIKEVFKKHNIIK